MTIDAQLDLFLDSRAVMLVNAIVAALLAHDASAAAAALDELRSHAPEHENLRTFDTLLAFLAAWRTPAADSAEIARRVRRLDEEIAPLAARALGDRGRAYLGAFFRELADAARDLPYSAAAPSAHRAWLCLRCGAWAEAEQAAGAIADATTNPDALQWLAIARYRQRGLDAARPALFSLAWHAPQRLAAALAELGDELLAREWRRFSAASEWISIDEAELPAWFPAWYLVEYSAATDGIEFFDAPVSAPAEAARLLKHLYGLERRGDWRALAGAREKLRTLDDELFALYMARRARSDTSR